MSDLNVAFMIDVDGDKMAGKQSLITRIGILSIPGPLSLAFDMMTFLYLFAPYCVDHGERTALTMTRVRSLFLLPIVPARFFLLPSLTSTQSGLRGEERPETNRLYVQLT